MTFTYSTDCICIEQVIYLFSQFSLYSTVNFTYSTIAIYIQQEINISVS